MHALTWKEEHIETLEDRITELQNEKKVYVSTNKRAKERNKKRK